MQIIFLSREYEAEHGHSPKGYGFWVFSFEGYTFSASGTLTEAKKACRTHIRQTAPKGYTETVFVNIEP